MEKAFDSLEWNFMGQCLRKYFFQKHFCTWIKNIYTNPSACIKILGYLTELIKISRGAKQGYPFSALLFIIAFLLYMSFITSFLVGRKEVEVGYSFGLTLSSGT